MNYLPAYEESIMEAQSIHFHPTTSNEVLVSINSGLMQGSSLIEVASVFVDGNQHLQAGTCKSQSRYFSPYTGWGSSVVITPPHPSNSTANFLAAAVENNLLDSINADDEVYLLCRDHKNNFKVYKGIVKNREARDRRVNFKAVMGNAILAERIIRVDYPEQDIGLSVKEIIDTYCPPLTTSFIDIHTGYIAPINSMGKKPITVLERLRREYPIHYHTDHSWAFHFYLRDDIKDTNWEDESLRSGHKLILGSK
ncbi:MAG: hypothetical protein ACOCZ3_00940 [Bacillota bacterium]